MKKLFAVLATVVIVSAGAGTALAGEVTGTFDDGNGSTPMYTPISPLSDKNVHTSACAFSGLEDGVSLQGPVTSGPGITQTPHYEAGMYPPPGSPAKNLGYNCVGLSPGKGPRP